MQDYQNINFRSRYTRLQNTWCGQHIPSEPYVTYNPPLDGPSSCPSNYMDNRIPRQDRQIVLDYNTLGYNSLTHNVPYTQTQYFKINPAYNTNKELEYRTVIRKCDGSL